MRKKNYSRNFFLIQFHILCANFRRIGWKMKNKLIFMFMLKLDEIYPIQKQDIQSFYKTKTGKTDPKLRISKQKCSKIKVSIASRLKP